MLASRPTTCCARMDFKKLPAIYEVRKYTQQARERIKKTLDQESYSYITSKENSEKPHLIDNYKYYC
jgi:hypothetical protein